MKNIIQYLVAIPLALLIMSPAQARNSHDNQSIQIQLTQQNRQIARGQSSGRLSIKETRQLRREQRHIRQLARAFRQDGHLSRWERRILERKLDAHKYKIRSYKRNDQFASNNNYRRDFRYNDSRWPRIIDHRQHNGHQW